MPTERLIKGEYRPEIDGLRAFAVITVIINHFNKEILPSGYLGVDIFFVISGYVITSSLAGRKSRNFIEFISSFYQRRVKRLLPALSFFILITSILTNLFIQNAGEYYLTAALSIFGVSNIFLSIKSVSYWGIDSLMNPFIHTWSLGVEEQFYFLFPIIIWLTGFGQQKYKGSRNLFISVLILTIISLIYFIYLYLYSQNKSGNYFLMPNRFWEMSSGCLVFLTIKKIGSLSNYKKFVSPTLILLAIILTMFMPESYIVFSTVLIVIFTCLLIFSLRKDTLLFNLLSKDKFVHIGLMSYSLYLWHWGILSISRWTIGIHWWSIPFQAGMIYLISTISYEFIEKKFRNVNPLKNKLLESIKILSSSILIAIFTILLGTSLKTKFYLGENRSKNPPENMLKDSKFFIIGDSHAYDIESFLKNNKTFKTRNMTIGGCEFYKTNTTRCKGHLINKEKLISEINKGDVVLLASDYSKILYESNKTVQSDELYLIKSYLNEILSILDDKGAITILKLQHPKVNLPAVDEPFLCKKEFFRPYINPECFNTKAVSKEEFIEKNQTFNELMFSYSEIYKKFFLWDITSIVCPESKCVPITKNNQYYRDEDHLFITSATLSDSLIKSFNNILTKSSSPTSSK